jgi:hypothetical protein
LNFYGISKIILDKRATSAAAEEYKRNTCTAPQDDPAAQLSVLHSWFP